MTFKLRLDGKDIASVDEQVLSVRLQTARGETAAMGVAPNEGNVDIILERVAPGGPPRLDQIEAAQMQALRDRSQEGMVVGYARDHQVNPHGIRADQGQHDETLREGGPRRNDQTVTNGPTRDLSEGLSSQDTETLTRRLEAFAEHGDTDRAINDNPAGGNAQFVGTVYEGTAADSLSSPDSPITRDETTTDGAGSTTSDSDDGGSSSGPKGSGSESEASSGGLSLDDKGSGSSKSASKTKP